MTILAVVIAAIAFTLSVAAGMGGSLVLVPAFALIFGAKQGIALAALMLAANNVGKIVVYRKSIPLRKALWVIVLTMAGAFVGAGLLVAAPEEWVQIAVIASISFAFLFEWKKLERIKRPFSAGCALFAGASSGFSGTSGPLKGIALRTLRLDHLSLVGAASAVSFAGDVTKAAVFAKGSIIESSNLVTILWVLPVIPFAAVLGRRINRQLGERYYGYLFWSVMAGYLVRLMVI